MNLAKAKYLSIVVFGIVGFPMGAYAETVLFTTGVDVADLVVPNVYAGPDAFQTNGSLHVATGTLTNILMFGKRNSGFLPSHETGWRLEQNGVDKDCTTGLHSLDYFEIFVDEGYINLSFSGTECTHQQNGGPIEIESLTAENVVVFPGTDPAHTIFIQGSNGPPLAYLDETYVVYMDPFTGQPDTLSSTTLETLEAAVHISDVDFQKDTWVEFRYCRIVQCYNPNESAPYTDETIVFPLLDFQSKTLSTTTTDYLEEGVYMWTASIKQYSYEAFGFGFWETVIAKRTERFTVGQPTALDSIFIRNEEALAGLSASTTDAFAYCQFDLLSSFDLSENSNLLTCLMATVGSMVVPSSEQFSTVIDTAREEFLMKMPFGYATRIYDIVVASTSPETLPSVSITIPSELPGSGTLDLTPWGALSSANTRLMATTTATSTPWLTSMLYYWDIMWYILFAMWVMRRMFSQHSFSPHHKQVTV